MTTGTIMQEIRQFLTAGNKGVFDISSDGLSVRAQFSNIDSMSSSLAQLTIGFDSAIPNENLRERCDALSAQLTYLLEPVVVVECDADLATVQMRSNPPQTEDETRRYYELTATTSTLNLCRYQKQPGESRVQIDSVLTNEVVVRLINDLLLAARA